MKIMRKVASVILLLVLLVGCVALQPLKVGFSVGLTGLLANEGVSARYGFTLAIEEVNAAGDVNGQLLDPAIKDDAFNY